MPDDAVFKGYRSVVVQDLKIEPQNTGSYAQIVDTSARVNGRNHHTQIVCGEHYAAYFTTERKDRLTVLDVLRRFRSREFLCDDAPQFKLLTEQLALCRVHDGRHYKKLEPVVPHHARRLSAFRERYWDFYGELLAFKAKPTDAKAGRLSRKFDTLFATKTGYDALDERIAKTMAKKESLLAVHLQHPELPLHTTTPASSRRALRRAAATSASTPEPTKAPPPATR